MTVVLTTAQKRFTWLSSDSKPTLTAQDAGSMGYETNTGKRFIWTSAAWVQFAPASYFADILPITNNTYDLGSAALSWAEAHIETVVVGGSVTGNWSPTDDDTYDLGENSTPREWKDLYVDGIAYIDDMSVPNGFSMVSEVTAFSHFDHDNGAWDFFTKTSAAAQVSRLRIPNGTDIVDIAFANANLLFGTGLGIRANAANGTIVDFEAYENGAYVTVANMNSSATLANWTFSRNVAFTQAATLSTSTGVLTIDGDDGLILQTTGSGIIEAKEILAIGTGEGLATIATGLTLRAPSIIGGGTNNIAGADLTITGGAGTGTGDVGQIIFKTYQVGASGNSVQSTLETILTLDEDIALFAKAVNVVDDTALSVGTTLDNVFYHRTATLSADANLDGVLVGASQNTSALAANSLIISNITTDGDILIAVSDGGHSKQMIFMDGSTGVTHLGKPGGPGKATATGDVYMAGKFEVDGLFFPDAQIQSATGSVGAPAYSFNGDPNSGMYFITGDDLGFAAGGLLGLELKETSSVIQVMLHGDTRITDTKAITAGLTGLDDDFITLEAHDNDSANGTWIEVARLQAATDPYFSMGGSQQHKFYNSGAVELGTNVDIQDTTGLVQRMAYAQIMEILGDVSGFWPLVDATGTTVTDFTANGQDGTASKSVATWDTPPAFQGSVQVYDHDGVDEEWDVADNALFSTAGAFSVGIAVKMTDSTDSTLIAVWDVDNTFREFRLYLDANDYPTFACFDESGDDTIERQDQTALSEGTLHTVFAVFNGGTDAADIKIYVDGIQTDDATTVDDVGFADIEDTGAALMIGHIISTGVANLLDGVEWGPWYTPKELSADEVWNLHQIYRGLLNF